MVIVPSQTAETSSKARKRNKNKAQAETNVKSTTAARAPPATTSKPAPKDEPKTQAKPAPTSAGKPVTATPTTTTSKKPAQPVEDDLSLDQPFTVVGGNRHKMTTQSSQQQQSKPVSFAEGERAVSDTSTLFRQRRPPPHPPRHRRNRHRQCNPNRLRKSPRPRQLPQPCPPLRPRSSYLRSQLRKWPTSSKVRSHPPSTDVFQLTTCRLSVLPSSQLVVTELMSGLDAYPLTTDELDIIMQKIANKQSVVKKDWSKVRPETSECSPSPHTSTVAATGTESRSSNSCRTHDGCVNQGLRRW